MGSTPELRFILDRSPVDLSAHVLAFRGWVFGEEPVERLRLMAGPVVLAESTVDLPRRDVVQNFATAPLNCGFDFSVSTPTLARQLDPNTRVHLEAVTASGTTGDVLWSYEGDVPKLWGTIKDQSDDVILRDRRLRLQGTAVGTSDVKSVTVWANGEQVAEAIHGLDSPRFAERHPDIEGAARGRWHCDVDLRNIQTDDAAIEVRVQSADATITVDRRTMRFSEADAEWTWRGMIDAPEHFDRSAHFVAGWAICIERPVSRVELFVNGVAQGTTRMGMARPGLAQHAPVVEAPVAGFNQLIDLSSIPAEVEAVELRAVATTIEGDYWTLPTRRVPLVANDPVDDEDDRIAREMAGRSAAVPVVGREPGSPPRALIVTHDLGYGGGQYYVVEMLRRLVPTGRLAASIVSPKPGPLQPELDDMGVPVHIVDIDVGSAVGYERTVEALTGAIGTDDFDVVIANSMKSFPAVDAAQRLGKPSLWAIHESLHLPQFWRFSYAQPPHPYAQARHRHAMATTQAAVFEASATRDMFESDLGERRGLFLPWGLDLSVVDEFRATFDRSSARAEQGWADDETVVLCMGTVEARKAQARLAHAFSLVAARHPKARLVIVGDRDNPYSTGLHELRARSGFSDRIDIVPVVPEAETLRWFAMADAFVCASDLESMPRVIMEAMSHGLLVGATNIFGVPNLITHGHNGMMCRPNDLTELVGLLEAMLDPTADHAAIRSAARTSAERYCDAKDYTDDWATLIDAVVRDPSVSPNDLGLAQR